jgi:Na+-transporting NADH:ubiquinone oxidoreductase subunit C
MLPKDKDSIANTFFIATTVCLVCSLLVSAAAVVLKSRQERNVELDKKRNILRVSGFSADEIKKEGVDQLFAKRFKTELINLETGLPATKEGMEPVMKLLKIDSFDAAVESYDQIQAAKTKNPAAADLFKDKKDDIARLGAREKFSHVYLLMDESGKQIEEYVFPIRGYGLWSTLKGFLAVKPDFQTIGGLTYYEHGETPGLGGEVDNEGWKAKWENKKIYENGQVKISVVKGKAADTAAPDYGVDGLSGATITSKGVSNMLKYWLGPEGFGTYIEKQKSGASATGSADADLSTGDSNG